MSALTLTTETAKSISRDSHACYMMAAAISLNMVSGLWPRQFLLSVKSGQIADVVKDMDTTGYTDVLIKNNLLSPANFEKITDTFLEGKVYHSWQGESFTNRLANLASPLLDTQKVRSMLEAKPHANVRAGLMANPNCPRELVQLSDLTWEQRHHYQESLAIFGDLNRSERRPCLLVTDGAVDGPEHRRS